MSGVSSPDRQSIFSDSSSFLDGPVPKEFIRNYRQQSEGQEETTKEFSDFILVFNSDAAKETISPSKDFDKEGEEYSKLIMEAASEALMRLIKQLTCAGLKVEVGDFGKHKVALFLTCPITRIKQEYLSSKIHDYLHGIRVSDIENFTSNRSKNELLDNVLLTTAERLRLVHDILTNTTENGGAGISQINDPFVECLYPVHDRNFNRDWLKRIYKKWRVNFEDLTLIRNHFGEELAYYFAFVDFYFAWLLFPAIVGLVFYLFLEIGSSLFGIIILGWATVFLEAWSRKQSDLAVKWEVVNSSRVEKVRPEFKETSVVRDPVTNELKPVVSFWNAQLKKFASIPIILLLGSILGSLVVLSFVVEIIIVDFYSGPFKNYLSILPTLVYMGFVGSFSSLYSKLSIKLTAFENHRTESEHNHFLSQKIFIVNFLVSYLSIFLISWVYIPYCDEITEFLKEFLPLSEKFQKVGLSRLQAQLFFFVVTSQAVNFFTETVVPLALRYGGRSAQTVTKKAKDQFAKLQNDADLDQPPSPTGFSQSYLHREMKKFELEYAELQPYTTYEDYAEMVIQFGYIVLFSVIFPLAPVVGFLNNWVELRSDSVKIVMSHRRLVPRRVENIGPWLGNMGFLIWLGSIVNGILIYQFSSVHFDVDSYNLLAALVVAIIWEHGWILFSRLVRSLSTNIPTFGEQVTLKETYQLKTKLMGQSGVFDLTTGHLNSQDIGSDSSSSFSNEAYQDAKSLLHKNFQV